MLASLSKATIKQYSVSLNKWMKFCSNKEIDPFFPQEEEVIYFLTEEFNRGCSYGTLNTDRCAISLISKNKIGENMLIKRFLKGCFKLRPTSSKYAATWDVDLVLDFLENRGATETLCFKDLTFKTIMLLSLCTAQRAQTLSKIRVDKIVFYDSRALEILITDVIKNTRQGSSQPVLSLPKFLDRPHLCVYTCVARYLRCTEELRGQEPYLFISLKRPFVSVGSQTIARRIKQVLSDAGIDISIFKSHSTRHASTSSALLKGIDLDTIRKTAGWSEKSEVFSRFYNRPIIRNKDDFALALLKKRVSE